MVYVGSILGSHVLQVELVIVMVNVLLLFFVPMKVILQMVVLLVVVLYMVEAF